jgi:hypothetical protein
MDSISCYDYIEVAACCHWMPPLLQRERPNMTGACASERSAPSGRWREKGRSCWAQHKADTLNARVAHVQHRSRRMTQNTTHHVSSVKLGAWGAATSHRPKIQELYPRSSAQVQCAMHGIGKESHRVESRDWAASPRSSSGFTLPPVVVVVVVSPGVPRSTLNILIPSLTARDTHARTHARCGPRSANESSFFCATHYTHLSDKRQSFGFQLDASFTRKKK